MNRKVSVSVITLTRNRARLLNTCLSSLIGQLTPQDEVVVVDNCSTDETPAVLAAYASQLPLKVYRTSLAGFPNLYNLGIRKSRRPVLVFLDDDCEATAGYIKRIKQKYKNGNSFVLQGKTRSLPRSSVLAQISEAHVDDWFLANKGPGDTLRVIDNRNVAIPRQLLMKHGMFSPGMALGSEDVELGLRLFRAGVRIVFDPHLLAYHHERETLEGFLAQHFRIARSHAVLDASLRPSTQYTALNRHTWLLHAKSAYRLFVSYWKHKRWKNLVALPCIYLLLFAVRMAGYLKERVKRVVSLEILILLLFAGYFVWTLMFALWDKIPPHWDYANYRIRALEALMALEKGRLLQFVSSYYLRPAGGFVLLSLFFKFFGYSEVTIIVFNFSLLGVFLVITYHLIKKIKGTEVAAASTIMLLSLVATASTIGIRLWEFMLDFPQAVAVIAVFFLVYYDIKNNHFTAGGGILLGLACAFALLIRGMSAIYLIIPVAFYSFSAIRLRRFAPVFLFTAVIVLFSGGWYILHLPELLSEWKYYAFIEGPLWRHPQGWQALVFYARWFFRFGRGWLIFFIIAVFWSLQFLLKKESLKMSLPGMLTIASVGVPFLFFVTVMPTKDARYLFPISSIMVITTFWSTIEAIPQRKRWIMNTAVILYALASILSFLPRNPQKTSAIEVLSDIILRINPKTVAYFFENDSRNFNYGNVALLHHKFFYRKESFPEYEYLNRYDLLRDGTYIAVRACNFSELPEMIVVYSGKDDPRSGIGDRVSFESVCPANFRDNYQFKEIYELSGEKLAVYQKLLW